MKAYEFNAKTSLDGQLECPKDIQLPPNQNVRVVIITNEDSEVEQQDWSQLAVEQFLADYSEEDEIYNQI